MKALSLRQPFTWLTVEEGKNPENRTWNTPFRGWFLIHASAQWNAADEQLAHAMIRRLPQQQASRILYRWPERFEVGGIVGAARLANVLDRLPEECEIPAWRLPGQYGFQLEHVLRLPFVPCKGLQRFWTVKPNVKAALRPHVPDWLWRELEPEAEAA